MPFLVSMKFDKPASSSFLRRRATLTDKVLSSIKKSLFQSPLHHVITRHDTACMLKQDAQDLKFILGQLDDFSFIHQVRRLEIEDGATVLQQILICPKFVGTAQESLNLGRSTFWSKGLVTKSSPHIDGHDNIHGLIP